MSALAFAALAGALALGSAIPAQPSTFERARSFRCDFPAGSVRDISAKAAGPNEMSSGLRDIVFTAVDRDKGTATMVGNVGTEQVVIVATGEALTFVETTVLGSVIITTLFASTRHEVRDGPLTLDAYRAVMSRHIARAGRSAIVSSLDGTCRALLD
jgi:hypothetical protein